MPTADIAGSQRKVLEHSIRPARVSHGSSGIPVRSGKTQPFIVERIWSSPAGDYPEAFYLIDPATREVLFEGPVVTRAMWGLQARTEVAQTISTSFALPPGKYAVVFALGGVSGGEFPVEAVEVPADAVA